MKKIILFLLAITATSTAFADHHPKPKQMGDHHPIGRHYLLDAQHCKETKDGIGWFLARADSLFEDIEKYGKEKNRKWNDKKWREVSFFAELAADYSTVYQVWCKHIH